MTAIQVRSNLPTLHDDPPLWWHTGLSAPQCVARGHGQIIVRKNLMQWQYQEEGLLVQPPQ